METVILRNHPNNVLTRWSCALCHGETDKQAYHFELPPKEGQCHGAIVCDECAKDPESIPTAMRCRAAGLRAEADRLEAEASKHRYVTDVVPVPEDIRALQDGMYSEDDWPNWMRERIGLPAITDEERERRFNDWMEQTATPDNDLPLDDEPF